MQHSDARFRLEQVKVHGEKLWVAPVCRVLLTGGRIGYLRNYTVSPKHPSFAIQFNVLSDYTNDWKAGFKDIDTALSALEALARQAYDALAQCEFKY